MAMKIYSKDELVAWLKDYYDYSEQELSATVDLLIDLSPKTREMLNALYETGKLPNFEINGLTAGILRNKYSGINDVAILTIFDGFYKKISKIRKQK